MELNEGEIALPIKINLNYLITSHGRVYSLKGKRFLVLNTNGSYLRVDFNKKHHYVHRLVALYFCDNPNNKPDVNHKDGNKFNNNVTNLEWVTKKENVKHRYNTLNKKAVSGEDCHLSKLSKDDVNKIVDLLSEGFSCSEISILFNVGSGNISAIKNGRSWTDITGFKKYKKRG